MSSGTPQIKYRRGAWIVGAILVTAAVSGYFMGLRQTGSQLNPVPSISLVKPYTARAVAGEVSAVRVAGSYAEQRRAKEGPNANWDNHVAKITRPVADFSSLTNVTEEERAAALAERAARRAFDGAPPVVPHPINQTSAGSCLACHGEGLVVKDKVASKISHPVYTSCTQCHVASTGSSIPVPESPLLQPLAENQFVGLEAPLKGSRAWPLAPPTIPHSTSMRGDCLSCHGPQGLFGLRTPHPDRQACVQCHVPGADLDQRRFLPASTIPASMSPGLRVARQ